VHQPVCFKKKKGFTKTKQKSKYPQNKKKHPVCYVVAACLPVCYVVKEATKQNKNQNTHKNPKTSCMILFVMSSKPQKQNKK